MENRVPLQSEPSDEVLIARVTQHDVAAFTLLYDRYARSVYVLAAHMLATADAEDVVQEVFLRLWNKAGQFDVERGSFSTWFMAIARHHVLDELQRRSEEQRWVAAEEISQLLAETIDPKVNVEEEAWLRERGDAVLQALKNLPIEQQRALVLAYFGGLSQSSIAQYLGWPLGTVKKRMKLGLQKLKAFLIQRRLISDE